MRPSTSCTPASAIVAPRAAWSISGPSITEAPRANFSSSAEYGCTPGRPAVLARIVQPFVPSKTRTVFCPSAVSSNRVRSGRFCSSRNGILRPPPLALSTRPLQAIVWILRQASTPPRAAAFFSTTWAAVRVWAVAG